MMILCELVKLIYFKWTLENILENFFELRLNFEISRYFKLTQLVSIDSISVTLEVSKWDKSKEVNSIELANIPFMLTTCNVSKPFKPIISSFSECWFSA